MITVIHHLSVIILLVMSVVSMRYWSISRCLSLSEELHEFIIHADNVDYGFMNYLSIGNAKLIWKMKEKKKNETKQPTWEKKSYYKCRCYLSIVIYAYVANVTCTLS